MTAGKTATELTGSTFQVEIQGLTPEGEGLAAWNGAVVHVFGALPGETVEVVVKREKRQYLYCDVVQVIRAAPQREIGRASCRERV